MNFNLFPYGDNALLIKFDQTIDVEINLKVHQLSSAIISKNIHGLISVIPSYCSLVLVFDSSLTSFSLIKDQLKMIDISSKQNTVKDIRVKRIPICFDASFGIDLDTLCKEKDLSKPELVDIYCGKIYQVFMIGFLPGFPYMGKIAGILYSQRKHQPRLKIPKGSVGLAGNQTGIYPCESPGGWQIIANTPIDLLNPDDQMPILKAGDQVSFFSVNTKDYELIKKDVELRRFNSKSLYVW